MKRLSGLLLLLVALVAWGFIEPRYTAAAQSDGNGAAHARKNRLNALKIMLQDAAILLFKLPPILDDELLRRLRPDIRIRQIQDVRRRLEPVENLERHPQQQRADFLAAGRRMRRWQSPRMR